MEKTLFTFDPRCGKLLLVMIKKRLLNDTLGSYFLFGPRGTGKTTWLEERFPDAVRISRDHLPDQSIHPKKHAVYPKFRFRIKKAICKISYNTQY